MGTLVMIAAALLPLLTTSDGNGEPSPTFQLESSTVVWNVNLSGRIDGNLLAVERFDTTLIIVPLEEEIAAFDAATGRELWRRSGLEGGGLIRHAPPLLFDGPVLGWAGRDAEEQGVIEVLSALDGRTLWKSTLPAIPVGPPLAGRSGVRHPPAWFVPAEEGQILVLDNRGELVERVRMGESIHPPLIAVDRSVIADVGDGGARRMVIVGALSRRRARLPFVTKKAAVSKDDLAFSLGRRVHMLRCRTEPLTKARCRPRWKQSSGASMGRPLFFDDFRVIVPSWDSFIYAFRRDNGHMLWKRGTNVRPSHLTRFTAYLIISTAESSARVDLLHAVNGTVAGSFQAEPLETIAGAGIALPNAFIAAVERPPMETHLLRRWHLEIQEQSLRAETR